ncbi:MAG: histidinol dehydrogenase [Acidobacteria bacterium]|nr:histidinol dehydrogenase [Acidobacteriota bacterium]
MIRIIPYRDSLRLLERKAVRLTEAERVVAPIVKDVRLRGDAALLDYARTFDNFTGQDFRVSVAECASAADGLSPALWQAIDTASANIAEYARTQLPRDSMVDHADGRRLGQIVRPIDSMGAYIPSGRYPLPSTMLMTMIPAIVAGVRKMCVASPNPSPETLAIAHRYGVADVFRLGGAQAIAAFAYGTASVPRVQRIVGPGNIYVAAAKKLVAGDVGIDFVAGPTEIVVIARDGNPRWIAADMLAQAEHDTDASAILLTTSAALATAVASAIEQQIVSLPTAVVAREAIDRFGAIVVCDDIEQALEFSNRMAPEHLALHDQELLARIESAGSVFLGPSSPEAAGDYISGPNHVLPTSGAARLRGGLSAADFVKVISVQELSPDALARLTPPATLLARVEGLEAHARSMEIRSEGA